MSTTDWATFGTEQGVEHCACRATHESVAVFAAAVVRDLGKCKARLQQVAVLEDHLVRCPMASAFARVDGPRVGHLIVRDVAVHIGFMQPSEGLCVACRTIATAIGLARPEC